MLTSPPLLLGSYNSGRIDFFPAWVTLDLPHHFRAAARRQAVPGDIELPEYPSHLGSQMHTSQFLCLQVHDVYSSLCNPTCANVKSVFVTHIFILGAAGQGRWFAP